MVKKTKLLYGARILGHRYKDRSTGHQT